MINEFGQNGIDYGSKRYRDEQFLEWAGKKRGEEKVRNEKLNIELVKAEPCIEVKGEDLKALQWAIITCAPVSDPSLRDRLEALLNKAESAIEDGER